MNVFLSYAHEDRADAQALAADLRAAGLDVYPGSHWPEDPKAAIGRADAFVVLLSPAAIKSPFVDQEIKLALVSAHLADKVVPVVVRATTVPWILDEMQPIRLVPKTPRSATAVLARLRHPARIPTR
jgi:TIR domain